MSDGTDSIPASRFSGEATDDEGNPILSTDNDGGGSNIFGPAARRYIQSGVANGDFYLAPQSPDGEITDDNPLPYWTLTKAGGTEVRLYSVADVAAASGRAIQFSMGPGIAGDDTYVEQLIPINGGRSQNWCYRAHVAFRTGPTVSNAQFYLSAQYLMADGVTTTGTASGPIAITTTSIGANTVYPALASSLNANNNAVVPSDAYYLRLRAGFRRNTAGTSVSETATLCEVAVMVGSIELNLVDLSNPTTRGPFRLHQDTGVAFLLPNNTQPAGFVPMQWFNTTDGSIHIAPDNGAGVVLENTAAGAEPYLEMAERTDPTAPAANGGRLYLRDNGAGKTQLVIIFNSGAVQVIATQP